MLFCILLFAFKSIGNNAWRARSKVNFFFHSIAFVGMKRVCQMRRLKCLILRYFMSRFWDKFNNYFHEKKNMEYWKFHSYLLRSNFYLIEEVDFQCCSKLNEFENCRNFKSRFQEFDSVFFLFVPFFMIIEFLDPLKYFRPITLSFNTHV